MPSQFSFERACAIALGLAASLVNAAPCDIYAEGDTPCVAAHSTTRALYAAYSGSLYQVKRGSDNTTINIAPLSAGGVADADAQDSFCSLTTCLISIIYDQSGNGNHLTQAPPGGFDGPDEDGYDNLASAVGAPVTLNGQKAYGVFMSPGCGYRNDDAVGTATGDESEGMYAVLDGTHYNDACCFDYGNAETSNTDTGAGHMEAVYLGTSTSWGYGEGSGPWLMADMENNLFSGYDSGENAADPSITYRFFTGIVKGEADKWALRGGNAASGSLTTYYSGVRPSGYTTMSKEGAIILGIGGDNSNGAQGTFYEGVMTSGYPSTDTENSVQANIVAAKYAVTSLTSGPTLTAGDVVSLQVTTPGYTTRWIAHTGTVVNTQVVTSSSSTTLKEEASWTVVEGLGYSGCFSFESVDTPGSYIRHDNFVLLLNEDDGTTLFAQDATFCPETALNGDTSDSTLRSWSYPTRFFRHYDDVLYAGSNGGLQVFDATASFNDDVSFYITTAFAT
ncbi:alpha-L-arabinofuranosidase B [Penicillium malachiteum]|uniref:alpha-L-arabinofuranosidase B n=1 Tax=Penicillium malachiteum TaxID=1324776 RepID=UPI0025493F29|nr:alpha-L-arabinofuranosidase B [Penicillium malachiteum]KAJ5729958.1 alpha-L-arabinofuranosidase B [Penicillium malachiteum]